MAEEVARALSYKHYRIASDLHPYWGFWL